MTKLDWSKTKNSNLSFDSVTGAEWRLGSNAVSFDRPDGSDRLKLLAPPTIYWATELKRAFPTDTAQAHIDLFDVAWESEASLYYQHGWQKVRQRSDAIRAKASQRNPFPSAFYAIYFDWCAYHTAKWDHERRGAKMPPSLATYNSWSAIPLCVRARQAHPKHIDKLGIPEFYDEMRALHGRVADKRVLARRSEI